MISELAVYSFVGWGLGTVLADAWWSLVRQPQIDAQVEAMRVRFLIEHGTYAAYVPEPPTNHYGFYSNLTHKTWQLYTDTDVAP